MTADTNKGNWLQVISATLLLVSFFLPWVAWKTFRLAGHTLPSGQFFRVSETHFGLGNPFPQFGFTFLVFWLVPILAGISLVFALLHRKRPLTAYAAGTLNLSLLTVFYLFSNTLADLGVGKSAIAMLEAGFIASAAASCLLILSSDKNKWLKKGVFLLAGPVLAWGAYKAGEKYVMKETYGNTTSLKPDYTLAAADLLREFAANDTAATGKYREKIVEVTGTVAQSEVKSDSTVVLKFTGESNHFLLFSLEKIQYEKTRHIQPGDAVTLRGSCSGSSYSMILDSTSVDFKRTVWIN